jgi:ABC-type lipoprotein release transport system permease subunit|tara:strand:+ start:36350 stop:37666 length:1317 start_codon:yes stop_codon:yes gene_type:complete
MSERSIADSIPTAATAAAATAAAAPSQADIKRAAPELWAVAWRNIMRTKRRTWLTASGIAFAILLMSLMRSLQVGAFIGAVDNSARIMLGHIQLQHPDYEDDPTIENSIRNIHEIIADVESRPHVEVVSARAQSFALTSSGERSFGAQIIGVQYEKEAVWSSLTTMEVEGRYIERPGEAFIGSALARNLGIVIGDEMVVLGTAVEGGVAALVAEVVGTYTSGQPELDRTIVQVPLPDFQSAWELAADEAHIITVIAESVAASEELAPQLSRADVRSLNWRALQPEMVQMMELKLVGTYVLFILVAIIVIFSVVNSFMMIIFERTPEFGMLMAIGMRPHHIIIQLQIEALLVCLLGIIIGLAVAAVGIGILSETGIALPAQAEELVKGMAFPDRMYPQFSLNAMYIAIPVMLLGTQLAALIPGLRLRHMHAVEALRAAE